MINLKKKILNLINELFLQLYIMISFKNINSIICKFNFHFYIYTIKQLYNYIYLLILQVLYIIGTLVISNIITED